jgi:O-antigen ligase
LELTARPSLSGLPRAAVLGGLVLGVGALCGAAAAFAGPLYAVAGAFAAIVGLAMLGNSRTTLLAFVAVATLLPYGVVPVSVGGVRLTFIDITLTLLLLTWILRFLSQRETEIVATPVDLPLVLLIGLAIASFIFGTAYAVTPETTRQFLKLINSMLFFFTITQIVRTRRDLEMLIKALVVGGSVAAVIGVLLYHLPAAQASTYLRSLRPFGYPTGEVLRYVEDSGVRTTTLRAIGTSVDPNVFGALLLVTGALTTGWLLAARGPARRWLAVGVLAIVYALLLSLSRGSWIGFAIAGLVLGVGGYRRLFLVVPAVLLPAVVLFSGQLARYGEHFLKAVYAQDQATGMRLGEYKDALNLIQQNPWLGVGFGAAPSSDLYLGVSSTYLLVGEEMGLTGLAVYLLTIGTVIAVGVRGVRAASPATRPIALACLAAFAGVVVSATFDHHYFNLRYQHVSALFWMLAALVVRAPFLGPVDEAGPADNQPQ